MGTSNLVLNLAIALAEMDQRVVVVDADIGLANLDLLCGLTPRYDLGDVLAGRCRLFDALVTGPGEIQIVPGAHAIRTGRGRSGDAPARLVAELSELEAEADFVLVDAGSGLGPAVVMLAAAVEQAVIVSTPEPTSIADAHAAIGRFRPAGRPASPPGTRQSSRLDVRSRRRARPVGRLKPPVPGRRRFTAGDRFDPRRPARTPGGPRPQAVPDGVSRLGRIARGSAPGPRSGQRAPSTRPATVAPAFSGSRRSLGIALVASGDDQQLKKITSKNGRHQHSGVDTRSSERMRLRCKCLIKQKKGRVWGFFGLL